MAPGQCVLGSGGGTRLALPVSSRQRHAPPCRTGTRAARQVQHNTMKVSDPLPLQITPALTAAAVPARSAWRPYAVVYILITLPLIPRFQYSLYPDATSYLSIAEAYTRGEFWNAVNGYWAPLYCWVLAPLLLAGIDRLLAAKLLGLAIGITTLAGLWRLCDRLGLSPFMHRVALVAAIPSLVYWTVSYITPDRSEEHV